MIYTYQVSFSDVDFARVLFFGRYYEVVNRASEAWFHQYGFYFRDLLPQHDVRMPIVSSFCRHLGPAQLEDVLQVHLGIKDLSERGYSMPFIFYREGQERPVAWGYLDRRFVSGTGEARGAPEALQRALEAMMEESRSFVDDAWRPLGERRK